MLDRLRLPVVSTGSKQQAEVDNQTCLEQFISECCDQQPAAKTPFPNSTTVSSSGSPPTKGSLGPANAPRVELPVRHKTVAGRERAIFVPHLTLKPVGRSQAVTLRITVPRFFTLYGKPSWWLRRRP